LDSLQGDAKGGQETTSEDGSTVCGEGGSGTSGLTSVSRRRSGGGAAARAARGTTGAGRHGRARGRVCAGCVVATLLLEGQPALVLLVEGVASAVDARVEPVTTYETGDCLLVTAQLRGGERGSVGAVAGVLEGLLVADVAVGSDAAHATTELVASVELGLANLRAAVGAQLVGRQRAARDGCVVRGAVADELGRSASNGRSGDE